MIESCSRVRLISPHARIFGILSILDILRIFISCWLKFRLARRKFGHLAGMKKIKLKKVRRNKPKITKISIGKNRTSRNSCAVKVGGVSIEGMITLQKVGALV